MKWFSQHLNWTFTIILVLSGCTFLLMIPGLEIPGYVLFVVLNLAGGAWVLWKKGHNLWYLALAVIFYFGFVVLVLCLKDKETMQRDEDSKKIDDTSYYENR